MRIQWSPDGRVSRYDAQFLAGLRADPEVLPVRAYAVGRLRTSSRSSRRSATPR